MLTRPNIFVVGGLTATRFEGFHPIEAFSSASDPDAFTSFIRWSFPFEWGGFVIENLTNPRDFYALFRPNVDIVVLIEGAQKGRDAFERLAGAGLIRQGLALMHLPASRFVVVQDGGAVDVEALAIEPSRVPVRAMVQANLRPEYVFVEKRVFYDDDPNVEGFEGACTVFGVTSHKDLPLTFHVLTDQGAVFSNVPFHRVWHTLPALAEFDLQGLVYARCPDDHIVVTRYAELAKQRQCQVYLKRSGTWVAARYIATVDWWRVKDLAHIMALSTGQFALVPSHKVLMGVDEGSRELPPYKKLHAEWAVDQERFEDESCD